MSTPLTRQMLESVFAPEELLTVPPDLLGQIPNADVVEVLGTLGIPRWENPVFDVDVTFGTRFETVADWDWTLEGNYPNVPAGADDWIGLALSFYDSLAFDPVSGTVFCIPQEGEIHRVNSSLRAFVHFHYVLKSTKSEWDFAGRSADTETIRRHLLDGMTDVDPTALEIPDSCWPRVIDYLADPDVL
ncbi:SUKH-4 family immunity protein [Streptomyces sp. CA-111067]|uniref:SUKH-4 family immunity protein n=1 Tax=Streptomyces sp. CA-111067 TaxID=3240046 RepID=UPI003D96683C